MVGGVSAPASFTILIFAVTARMSSGLLACKSFYSCYLICKFVIYRLYFSSVKNETKLFNKSTEIIIFVRLIIFPVKELS